MSDTELPIITIRDCPVVSTAEVGAARILMVCFIRSHQISERIRAVEPVRERAIPVYHQALQDLQDEPGSIAHSPSLDDAKERVDYLRRCRKVFDGPAETLYELYRTFCAVELAIKSLTEIELGSSAEREFLMNEAYNRCMEMVSSPDETATLAAAVRSLNQLIPLYPKAMKLEPGEVIYYTLGDESRECRVIDCQSSRRKGDYFLAQDGSVGGPFEDREITASDMEDIINLAWQEGDI
ncbi:hypothetical protein BDV93DRAFT_604626 [Ceratobasidium sp. AG-I]|nr:hypothetical protein BDV93DRAFT_604626 [Ceratobasidium sp. AG-I]